MKYGTRYVSNADFLQMAVHNHQLNNVLIKDILYKAQPHG